MEEQQRAELEVEDEPNGSECHLRLKLEVGAFHDEPSNYILAYEGVVVAGPDQNTEVGQFCALVVDLEQAARDLVSPRDVLDSFSGSLAHHIPLVSTRTGEFTRRVQDEVNYEIGPILVLDYLELKEPYRGKGFGLEAIRIACQRLSLGCCLVSLRAFPVQWEGRVDEDPRAFRRDRAKLMRHYERAGFLSLGRDGLMVRAL